LLGSNREGLWIGLGLEIRIADLNQSRGRQRKRWIDVMKYNMEDLRLDLMDVENRAEWRRRTRVADPSPEGFNPA